LSYAVASVAAIMSPSLDIIYVFGGGTVAQGTPATNKWQYIDITDTETPTTATDSPSNPPTSAVLPTNAPTQYPSSVPIAQIQATTEPSESPTKPELEGTVDENEGDDDSDQDSQSFSKAARKADTTVAIVVGLLLILIVPVCIFFVRWKLNKKREAYQKDAAVIATELEQGMQTGNTSNTELSNANHADTTAALQAQQTAQTERAVECLTANNEQPKRESMSASGMYVDSPTADDIHVTGGSTLQEERILVPSFTGHSVLSMHSDDEKAEAAYVQDNVEEEATTVEHVHATAGFAVAGTHNPPFVDRINSEELYAGEEEAEVVTEGATQTGGSTADVNDEHEEGSAVERWMRDEVNLPQYVSLFISNGLDDMDTVRYMTDEELKQIGIDMFGHRLRIIKEIEKLNGK